MDSTYLVTAAAQYAQSVHAYTIDSAFVPRFELEGAKALTKKIGITHTLLPIDVLQNETVVQNPKDRCYFCKKAVFSTIWKAAKKMTATIFSLTAQTPPMTLPIGRA